MPSTHLHATPARRLRGRLLGAALIACAVGAPAVAGTESASALAKQPTQECVPGTFKTERGSAIVSICDGSGHWRPIGIRVAQQVAFIG